MNGNFFQADGHKSLFDIALLNVRCSHQQQRKSTIENCKDMSEMHMLVKLHMPHSFVIFSADCFLKKLELE